MPIADEPNELAELEDEGAPSEDGSSEKESGQ